MAVSCTPCPRAWWHWEWGLNHESSDQRTSCPAAWTTISFPSRCLILDIKTSQMRTTGVFFLFFFFFFNSFLNYFPSPTTLKRWINSWIPSAERLERKSCGFCSLSFPLSKHVRKESRRRRQVWATLQLWPRATFVLRGCSGYALEGIRTTWYKSYSRARRHLFSRVWSHSSWKAAHCWLW